MKLYLGVTDTQWYGFLKQEKPEEINFWQPGGGQGFKVLPRGGPFLFKLKAPLNAIGGVGFFSSHSRLPLSVAWDIFGSANGTASYGELQDKIIGYRRDNKTNPLIGCIVLTDPVFFEEADWIPVPKSWAPSIVQGKSYNTADPEGQEIWSRVQYTLMNYHWLDRPVEEKSQLVREPVAGEYRKIISRIRIGQGSFRVWITDAYQRKCAISGERTLPALEAAHIKPYAQSGPHAVPNGLLLRSDLHKLFDTGYLTITKDYKVEVSRRIKEEFENGQEYYRYRGNSIILPPQRSDHPNTRFLDWHNHNIFNG